MKIYLWAKDITKEMMFMVSALTNIESVLREYVNEIMALGVVDLSFRKVPDLPRIPIDPFTEDPKERKRVAHWLLLNASIDQAELVGTAINARTLLSKLYYERKMDDEIFDLTESDVFEHNIRETNVRLGRSREQIPKILASVNTFVRNLKNLYEWGKKFSKPENIVDQIARKIWYMGRDPLTSTRKKAWMYMRWMVRPKPDLRIWDRLNPADLYVPLDRNIAKVAVKFGILPSSKLRNGATMGLSDVKKVTEFARRLFPEDPAKVDYPFFLLGTTSSEGYSAKRLFNIKMRQLGISWP